MLGSCRSFNEVVITQIVASSIVLDNVKTLAVGLIKLGSTALAPKSSPHASSFGLLGTIQPLPSMYTSQFNTPLHQKLHDPFIRLPE